jgi:Tol biopolymer transport system component
VYRFGPRDGDWAIRWQPDGIALLLVSARDYHEKNKCSELFTARSINGMDCWSYYADVYLGDIHPEAPISFKRLTTTSSPSFKCELAWSPNGQQIAYARAVACSENGPTSGLIDGGIDILDLQTLDVKTLTDPEIGGLYQSNAFLQWSPSGDSVLFDALWMPDEGPGKHRMLVGNVKSTETRALTPEGARIGYWSPDGKKIVWEKDGSTLGITDVKSTQSQELQSLKDHNHIINSHGWSPDSRYYVWYEWADGGKGQAFRVFDVTAGKIATLLADMSVHSWAWSPDGKWLAFSVRDPFNLYIVKPDGTDLRNLTEGKGLIAMRNDPNGWGSGWYRDNAGDVQWVSR